MGGLGASLAAAAVAVLLFSGCVDPESPSGGPAGGSSQPMSTEVVEPTPGVFVARDRGALQGHVVNDAGFGLKNVRVGLVGSEWHAVTNLTGFYRLVNVTAGEYEVRAEAQGFQAHQEPVKVTSANVTTVDITMVPLEETGAGYRPHVHDFWEDAAEKTIMDQDVDLRKTTRNTGGVGGTQTQQTLSSVTYAAQNNSDNIYRIPLPGNGDPPALIFPGTKEVQVTVSWTSSAFTGTRVGLHVRTAAPGDAVFVGWRGSGQTWKFSVAPEMWDTGHQRFSLWEFWVRVYQDPADGANFRPGIINGNFHVKVHLVKGEILAEPAHDDFWAGSDRLLIHKAEDRLGECNSAYHFVDRSFASCRITPKGIVPPGTATLSVDVSWTYYQADQVAPGELSLVYRSPTQNPWTTHVTQYQVAKCNSAGVQKLKCEVTLKKGETDAYYQKRSMWAFTLAAKGHETEEVDHEPRTLTFRLQVEAVKDPAYAGPGEL